MFFLFGVFFKCACKVPIWAKDMRFLPGASSRSLLHVCEQQRLWRDCTYVQTRLSLCWSLIMISTLFSCAGSYTLRQQLSTVYMLCIRFGVKLSYLIMQFSHLYSHRRINLTLWVSEGVVQYDFCVFQIIEKCKRSILTLVIWQYIYSTFSWIPYTR